MKRSHYAIFLFVFLAMSGGARAQSDAFAGRSVQLLIGFGAGGGYDLWGRTVARHLGGHLPGNPNVIAQNMPGGGSFAAANHIYSLAPTDGSVIGLIARDAPLGPLSGADGARFDPLKLSWIGTSAKETNVCVSYKTAKVKTLDDALKTELIIGDAGAGDGTYTYPRALAAILGFKFHFVSGFPSSSDVMLAMERGEVEGVCESLDSYKSKHPEWLADKQINMLFQGGVAPNPEISNVPFVVDFARSEEDKQALKYLFSGQGIGRPFIAPPNLAPGRLAMLRDAFNATMRDPDFLADAKRQKLTVEPGTGEYLEALIKDVYATPPSVIRRVGDMIK